MEPAGTAAGLTAVGMLGKGVVFEPASAGVGKGAEEGVLWALQWASALKLAYL